MPQSISGEPAYTALAEQHAELRGILESLTPDEWNVPSSCAGWTVSDVVLHLAQTDEIAVASLDGMMEQIFVRLADEHPGENVDDLAAAAVARERGAEPADVLARWIEWADTVRARFAETDPSHRVRWVAGQMAARTLATTRLAECWIHTGDIADPLGIVRVPGERLQLIARLAWRTVPYSFARAGRKLSGPVAFELTGPLGVRWDFVPDGEPLTTIRGDADDLCAVASRRVGPESTSLTGEGPDAEAVLELVRTWA
jgi:uncharacterized protein (TIGR03084 family)